LSKLSSDVRSWLQTAVGEAHQAASSEQLTKGQMTKRRRQAAAQKIQMHPVSPTIRQVRLSWVTSTLLEICHANKMQSSFYEHVEYYSVNNSQEVKI